jgi:transcription elongation GreA/GreB family factor
MLDPNGMKKGLLAAVIAQVEAKLAELRAGYGSARDATLSAPHVMKGKREVFGQEAAYLANALSLNIQERELELRALRGLRLPAHAERVALGSLVGMKTEEQSEAFYLLLPVCGGMEISPPEGSPTVRVLTPAAPAAKALLGKEIGDEVVLPTTPPRAATVTFLV